MKSESITLARARQWALAGQFFGEATAVPAGKEGVAQVIEGLGYVQIDTISVVARAHDHALWVRCPDYGPELLHTLLATDRRVYEYWGHAASYLPMDDFRYTLPLKQRHRQPPTSKWELERMQKSGHLLEPVLQRIRAEGPLRSQDFDPPPGRQGGSWWDWKPAKIALELLFWRGDLMVTERRSFQRVYDLTERVLPSHVDTRVPDERELGHFLVRRALSAHGFAPAREIRDHLRGASQQTIDAALSDLVDSGEVTPIQVETIEGTQFYALTAEMAQLPAAQEATVSLLSPFDNLIIQRNRIQQLFNYHYTLECYVPAEKRIYGYFVFSILFGDRLVGRFDPKADRQAKVLQVRRLQFESDFDVSDHFLDQLAQKLIAYARFTGCNAVALEEVRTKGVVRRLRKRLKN